MVLEVAAHAKLTLTLRVLGTRADGFHELEALTVSLAEPADRLTVTRRDGPGVGLVLAGTPRDVPPDATNLVVRAVRALVDGGHAPDGWDLRLTKGIPAGGGLGGGSADAAASLRAVQHLVGGPSDAVVAAVGASLGSDVPFCLTGGGAWMRGRGERVDPVAVGALWVVVATPPLAVSTPAVYRAWDELGGPTAARRLPAPGAVAHLTDALANDLEPAAEVVEPRLAAFRADLEEAVGLPALLAGSGASYAVVCADETTARRAAAAASRVGITARAGPTVASAWRIVEP